MKARQDTAELPVRDDPAAESGNIAEGVRRLVVQRFEYSISMLKDMDIPGPQLVHQLRKNMKNIRAGLRLLSGAGHIDLSSLEGECGEIGRALSRLRDYDVIMETIAVLEGAPTGGHDSEAWRRFGQLIHDGRNALLAGGMLGDEWRETTIDRLDRASRSLGVLDSPATDITRFEYALALARRKARKALRKLGDDTDEEGFHRLRKRSKRELYQRRFLQSCTGTPEPDVMNQLDLLCEGLGQHQDLVVLIELAESNGLLTDDLGQWLNSLAARLRARTKALATVIYL